VARQTVTTCRAERPIWDDTGSIGLKFSVNKCLKFISYESCLFLHVRELGDPTPLLVRPEAIACGADLCFSPDVFLVRPKTIVFGRTSVLLQMFYLFFPLAKSPRCVGRPA